MQNWTKTGEKKWELYPERITIEFGVDEMRPQKWVVTCPPKGITEGDPLRLAMIDPLGEFHKQAQQSAYLIVTEFAKSFYR